MASRRGCCADAGLGRHREAALVLEEGSKIDPLNGQMRLHLQAATQGVLKDLVEGVHPSRPLGVACTQFTNMQLR
jgi:hypothetical protein